MYQVQFSRISNLSYFFMLIMFILGRGVSIIMTKKECKDEKCEIDIPDLSSVDNNESKIDKKDSSKRLR